MSADLAIFRGSRSRVGTLGLSCEKVPLAERGREWAVGEEESVQAASAECGRGLAPCERCERLRQLSLSVLRSDGPRRADFLGRRTATTDPAPAAHVQLLPGAVLMFRGLDVLYVSFYVLISRDIVCQLNNLLVLRGSGQFQVGTLVFIITLSLFLSRRCSHKQPCFLLHQQLSDRTTPHRPMRHSLIITLPQ